MGDTTGPTAPAILLVEDEGCIAFLERTGAPGLLKPHGTRDLLEALRRMCAQPAAEPTTALTPHQKERRAAS
jgi:hypothetical protein